VCRFEPLAKRPSRYSFRQILDCLNVKILILICYFMLGRAWFKSLSLRIRLSFMIAGVNTTLNI